MLACFLVVTSVESQERLHHQERSEILKGVSMISAPGLPGTVCAFGENAFPVVLGKAGSKTHSPVVAASRFGEGRAVIFGHTDYLERVEVADAESQRLILNSILWARGASKAPVGLRKNLTQLFEFLNKCNIPCISLGGSQWASYAVENCSVICCLPADLNEEDAQILEKGIVAGKGFLAAETGWGWQQIHPKLNLTQHPGNRLLQKAGLMWSDGTLEPTSKNGFSIEFPLEPSLYQATEATKLIQKCLAQKKWLTPENNRQAIETMVAATRILPENDQIFRNELMKTIKMHTPQTMSQFSLVDQKSDPLPRLVATLEAISERNLPLEKMKASPSAASFPGSVATKVRVRETIKIDPEIPEWHSTGLYAAPGEVVTVDFPEIASKKGFSVRIGAHTDTLWNLDKWDRAPEISRLFPVITELTKAGNPYGGLIYIVVPQNCKLGVFDVSVSNAVKAPHFILGKTTDAMWNQTVSKFPAPWTELEGQKVILTVPTSAVWALTAPTSLMTLWDRSMDDVAYLAGIPQKRVRPERYVTDKQISAGYMHSGYPIMTFLDVAKPMATEETIRKNGHGGVWGFWHEVGHNHQQPDWTFEGTGEVTNNLFALYVFEKEFGVTENQHPALREAASQARMKKYFDNGAKWEDWKSDPFLALSMYIQLQKKFGWEPFIKTFTAYRYLRASERPKTELEKHDQWMVRFSHAAETNLAPFFQKWGMPTTEAARKSIANLKAMSD